MSYVIKALLTYFTGQLPISTDGAAITSKTTSEQSITSIDDERTLRTGAVFRKMLETYG